MRFIGSRQAIGYTFSAAAGLLLAFGAGHLVVFAMKAGGAGDGCPWRAVAGIPRTATQLVRIHETYREQLHARAAATGLTQVEGAGRTWWLAEAFDAAPAQLARELSRHELVGAPQVRPGDVVVDTAPGAGALAALALNRGAAKVVLIERDPLRRDALTRTFAQEVANLRVAIVDAAGADETVQHLGLARIDLLRAAGPEALAAASGSMRRWHPRILVDSAAPEVTTRLAEARYTAECVACGVLRRGSTYRIEPAALHFR